MTTFQQLPIGVGIYFGDDDKNTFVVDGTVTSAQQYEPAATFFTYSYGVYDIATFGGDDIVYLRNLTAVDPAGVNPNARQTIDLGAGNDFAEVRSLTAATIYGGDGNDTIVKFDLRSSSHGSPNENGDIGTFGYGPLPAGFLQDINWEDFNIVDGGAGDDFITMANGHDWVYGGEGNDFISLGSGNNVAFGGSGNDTIIVEGLTGQQVAGGVAANRYAPSTNAIWGGDGNDSITIRWVENPSGLVAAVNGEGGNDFIAIASRSASWVTGGDGDDTVVLSSVPIEYTYGTHFSQAADTVWGDAGNDIIDTEFGDDLIVGGTGHDWIFGGYGSDHLYGSIGGGVGDGETDRFSFGDYFHRDFNGPFSNKTIRDIDNIYDFEPGSRFPGQQGRGDIIDLAAMFAADDTDALVYDAGNPFSQGELRLLADGADTFVQANNNAGGWDTFLVLRGVSPGELNIAVQADVSAGLASATGGDFIWFTG